MNGHLERQYSCSDEACTQAGTGSIHAPAICISRAMADHGPPQMQQVKLPVAPNGVSRPETGRIKPGSSWPGGTTGQRQIEHVCFGCGKVGHIQINCPYKKAKPHAAAAVRIQKEVDTGMTGNVAPMDDTQEGETPP